VIMIVIMMIVVVIMVIVIVRIRCVVVLSAHLRLYVPRGRRCKREDARPETAPSRPNLAPCRIPETAEALAKWRLVKILPQAGNHT
jgi:hypothetical protein